MQEVVERAQSHLGPDIVAESHQRDTQNGSGLAEQKVEEKGAERKQGAKEVQCDDHDALRQEETRHASDNSLASRWWDFADVREYAMFYLQAFSYVEAADDSNNNNSTKVPCRRGPVQALLRPLPPFFHLVLGLLVEVLRAQVQHLLHFQHVAGARVGARVQDHLSVPPHAVLDRFDNLKKNNGSQRAGGECV